MAFGSFPLQAADITNTPFQSVLVREDTIIATLPGSGIRWLIESGSTPRRSAKYGEAFTHHAGTSLRLTEKHSSYSFTARVKPFPGLKVVFTSDTRSFGGTIISKTYFIPAR
jgi:hypothetical protein